MAIVFILCLLLVYTQCQIELRYSFCPVSNDECEPILFGSNTTLTFGMWSTSDIILYKKSQTEQYLVISCTSVEPLRWILVLSPKNRVDTQKAGSWARRDGENMNFYYKILIGSFGNGYDGRIRCESYENSSRAAEVYVATEHDEPMNAVMNRGLVPYVAKPLEGAELGIPCSLAYFNPYNYDFSVFKLVKLDMNMMIPSQSHPSVTDDCLRCMCKDDNCSSNSSTCAKEGNCGPLQISYASWNYSGKPRPDKWNSTIDEWSACALDFKCASQVVRKFSVGASDCNGDDEVTCSDHFSFTSTPEDCEFHLDVHVNFDRIEGCLSKRIGQKLSQAVADFDPRIGFRLRKREENPAIYQCSDGGTSSGIYLIPIDPSAIIQSSLMLKEKGFDEDPAGIICSVPKEWGKNVALFMTECTSLFHCDSLVHKLSNTLKYKGRRTNTYVGYSISEEFPGSRISGNYIPQFPSHGIVVCSGYKLTAYVENVDYFFTGLDHKSYFTSKPFPTSAVIRLTVNDYGVSGRVLFQCSISTFMLFPTFKFTLKYSNGSLLQVSSDQLDLKHGETQLFNVSSGKFEAELTLSVVATNDLMEVSCESPWINSTKWVSKTLPVQFPGAQTNPTDHSGGSISDENLTLILTPVCVIIIVISAIAGLLAYKKLKQTQFRGEHLRELTVEEVNEFLFGSTDQVPNGSNDAAVNIDAIGFPSAFQIQPTDINIDMRTVLGEGQFGKCVAGEYKRDQVALKLTKSVMDVESFKDFLREMKIMAFLGHHGNIIQFFGAVVDRVQERICIAVLELSPFGDLLSYLRKNNNGKTDYVNVCTSNGSVSWTCRSMQTRLSGAHLCYFCEQIASGMDFVVSKKVIHGDLAARNILVFPDFLVKITDFGLSRKLYNTCNYMKKKKTPLPWRWMALESLKYLEFSGMSDVWAFGVTAWEIFSMGQVPYSGLSYSEEFVVQLQNGLRPMRPAYASDEVFQFFQLCWDRIPWARPTFCKTASFFRTMKKEYSQLESNGQGSNLNYPGNSSGQ